VNLASAVLALFAVSAGSASSSRGAAPPAPAVDLSANASVLEQWLGFACEGGLPSRPEQVSAVRLAKRWGLVPARAAMARRRELLGTVFPGRAFPDSALRALVAADMAVARACKEEMNPNESERRYRRLSVLLPSALLPSADAALPWLDAVSAMETPACQSRLANAADGNGEEETARAAAAAVAASLAIRSGSDDCLVAGKEGDCLVTVGEFNDEAAVSAPEATEDVSASRQAVLGRLLMNRFQGRGGADKSKASAAPATGKPAGDRLAGIDFALLRKNYARGRPQAAFRIHYLVSSDSSWLARFATGDSLARAAEWIAGTTRDLPPEIAGRPLPDSGPAAGPWLSPRGYYLVQAEPRRAAALGEGAAGDFDLVLRGLEQILDENPDTGDRLLQAEGKAPAAAPDTLVYRLWLAPRAAGSVPDTSMLRPLRVRSVSAAGDLDALAWNLRDAGGALQGPFPLREGDARIRIEKLSRGRPAGPAPKEERLLAAARKVAAAGLLGIYPATEDEPVVETSAQEPADDAEPKTRASASRSHEPRDARSFQQWKSQLSLGEAAVSSGLSL
jgi:hypothetical protein